MRLHSPRSKIQPYAWRIAGVTASLALTVTACGVPLDKTDRPLTRNDLGYKPVRDVPAPTTTTSTTTTTFVTPSSIPATTPPSTALKRPVYPLDVFWIDPFGQIVSARRTQEEGNGLANAINALRYGPLSIGEESSMRSAIVDSSMIVDAALAGGVATIELSPEFLNLPGPEQSLAIAQIVFTVTPTGIGRVRFRVNGRPIAVPLANGQPTTGSVSRDDYTTLRGPVPPDAIDSDTPIGTSGITETTATTVPASPGP
jgi:Sporulation and spore germination